MRRSHCQESEAKPSLSSSSQGLHAALLLVWCCQSHALLFMSQCGTLVAHHNSTACHHSPSPRASIRCAEGSVTHRATGPSSFSFDRVSKGIRIWHSFCKQLSAQSLTCSPLYTKMVGLPTPAVCKKPRCSCSVCPHASPDHLGERRCCMLMRHRPRSMKLQLTALWRTCWQASMAPSWPTGR